MALRKNSYNPWSTLFIFNNLPYILIISLFIFQLHFSGVRCTNKTHEVKHFVLVHGLNHGAWCWFKLIPFLEAAGHNVTAIDLSASGINPRQIQDLKSFYDYSMPLLELMDSLPPNEKVILVGHSLGGLNLALAMDMYPEKIYVAVFATAFLPDTAHRPSYVFERYLELSVTETFFDTLMYNVSRPDQMPLEVWLFGPNTLKYSLYHLCRPEDLKLGQLLVRPGSVFANDLSVMNNFSEERFGSVRKVYIKVPQDRAIPREFQHWMIENNGGVKEVKEIRNADHMLMISRPHELCKLLLEEAESFHSQNNHII